MSDLQSKYPVEYATYNLSSVAVAIVFPLIKKQLQVSGTMTSDTISILSYTEDCRYTQTVVVRPFTLCTVRTALPGYRDLFTPVL